jgi:5'-nucleotidase
MTKNNKPQILLTNDDGILSPGLWAAAGKLSEVGYVTVVAPREQSTGMGRSLPGSSDGIIEERDVQVNGQSWKVYAVGGSPAQAVIHGILEVMPKRPDIVVSGINYGENLGTGITISGTVGAAMEAAAMDVPSIAVSLETEREHHTSYSTDIDFSAAAHFTAKFASAMLNNHLPEGVDLLKLEIPASATNETEWKLTRLSRMRYYKSLAPKRDRWDVPGKLDYARHPDLSLFPKDSDVYVMCLERKVAVTPLMLDMTALTNFGEIEDRLKES